MAEARQPNVFGRRKAPHTIIIARGEEIRHFTIRPWAVAVGGSVLSAIAIGYLLATSYLVLRDDLLGASAARQARLQQSYEDRISGLRAQVDRITSRQLLDQQLMEGKVAELLQRQSQLTQRHGRMDLVIDRAEKEAGKPPAKVPHPAPKPDLRAQAPAAFSASLAALPDTNTAKAALSFWNGRETSSGPETSADRADRVFLAINQSLRLIESDQLDRIDTLASNAAEKADTIAQALEDAGLAITDNFGTEGVGGPLIPVNDAFAFETKVRELDETLNRLDGIKEIARKMPIHNPAPGARISSNFGVRKDPLLGISAVHAGMDFRVAVGTDARATGSGVVTKAGWNGGYGRMVEVDHGGGFTTRYAHLNKVSVAVGDRIETGQVVGQTGTSGRSTGPHLHYEVRKDGEAANPIRFLKVGKRIGKLL